MIIWGNSYQRNLKWFWYIYFLELIRSFTLESPNALTPFGVLLLLLSLSNSLLITLRGLTCDFLEQAAEVTHVAEAQFVSHFFDQAVIVKKSSLGFFYFEFYDIIAWRDAFVRWKNPVQVTLANSAIWGDFIDLNLSCKVFLDISACHCYQVSLKGVAEVSCRTGLFQVFHSVEKMFPEKSYKKIIYQQTDSIFKKRLFWFNFWKYLFDYVRNRFCSGNSIAHFF